MLFCFSLLQCGQLGGQGKTESLSGRVYTATLPVISDAANLLYLLTCAGLHVT